jgi:hypothetical protein
VLGVACFLLLTSGCAQGEDIQATPVQLVSTDAGAPHEAGAGGRRGSVGSGGVPSSTGGTAATGGRSGGGEVTGSGGAPSKGGASGASGGSSSGGAKASGGTSSGGAQGSGGRAAGGSQGSGGSQSSGGSQGSGGAMQCPSYPTPDACSTCICKSCASQVASCYTSSDSTKNDQCKAIQECAQMNHCASTTCYCGPNNPLCTPANGPCATQINTAAGGTPNPLQIQTYSMDNTHPIGRANDIGLCTQSNCKTECGL